jgi:MYXO-CTERM domain-containing protein
MLLDLFGPAPAPPVNQAPTCSITSPGTGATVAAGFAVVVSALDDAAVSKVELYIDNQLITFKSAAPYTFSAPTSLAPGAHTVKARALDAAGLEGSSTVNVTLGQPQGCQSPADCPSGQTCESGQCVTLPTTNPGGIGSPCTQGSDCESNQCGSGPGGTVCTEPCDPSASPSSCPDGFECLAAGGGGACWPSTGAGGGSDGGPGNGADSPSTLTGGCGCSVGGRAPAAPLAGLLGLALVGWPLVRRRRR